MQLHERLKFDEEGRPMLYVFENCRDFRRTIPALVYDARKPEDIDTAGEDHIYDETRYFSDVKADCAEGAEASFRQLR